MVYVWFVAGLVVLVVGAELLVRGAVVLAAAARISSLVIGLTVVAFGTSAPELAVSAISSLKGDAAIALGNVVGSNIFNVLFILGLSAIIVPLTVTSQLVRLDVPLMMVASCGTWLAAVDGAIDGWEAALMFGAFVAYTIWLIRMGESETSSTAHTATDIRAQSVGIGRIWGHLALVVVGLALLVLGARWLVAASIEIAQTFGVSDMIIGLTIVAAGTSLPELATSIVAALKGERDIAVGNVVGSNVFNLLAVLASASLLSKSGVEVNVSVLWFDLLFMVWVALLCWPMFKSHGMLSRTEGGVMLLLYIVYTIILILDAQSFEGIQQLKDYFAYGAVPLIVLVTCLLAWREHKRATVLSKAH